MTNYTVRYNMGGSVNTRSIQCEAIREEGSYTLFLNAGEEVVAAIPTSLMLDIFEVTQVSP